MTVGGAGDEAHEGGRELSKLTGGALADTRF